jgi:hypothetical protein
MRSLVGPRTDITCEFNAESSEEHRKILRRACDVAGHLFQEMRPAEVRIEITAGYCEGLGYLDGRPGEGDILTSWRVLVTHYVDLSKVPPVLSTDPRDE